jgi:hypothetical protein
MAVLAYIRQQSGFLVEAGLRSHHTAPDTLLCVLGTTLTGLCDEAGSHVTAAWKAGWNQDVVWGRSGWYQSMQGWHAPEAK